MTEEICAVDRRKHWRRVVLYAVCYVMLSPMFAAGWLHLMSFETASKGLSLIPGLGGMWMRRVWYKATLSHCGENLYVDFLGAIRTPKTSIGNNVYIGHSCWIGWADIGDDVMLGGHIVVLSGARQHEFKRTDVPIRLQEGHPVQVKIGRDVWVGNGSIIAADVSEGSVVGLGSVVTKTHPPYSIIVGVPARVVRSRIKSG